MWSVQGSVAHSTGERGECTGRGTRDRAGPGGGPWPAIQGLCPDSSDTQGSHTADTDTGSTRTGFRNQFGHPDLSHAYIAIGTTSKHLKVMSRKEKGIYEPLCLLFVPILPEGPDTSHRAPGAGPGQADPAWQWVWDEGNRAGQNWSKENWRN